MKHNNEHHARYMALIGAVAGAMSIVATGAIAGDCPADKRVADGKGEKAATHMAKDVTDVVRAVTDLSKEPLNLNRQLRIRQLDIKPGGIVPWHSHDERPAMIYIVKGTVTEYMSNCSVPIVHKPGDVAAERRGIAHWWRNTGNEPALLISLDICSASVGLLLALTQHRLPKQRTTASCA